MRQPPHVREIWDYILMNANHADSVLTGGRKIKRGQLFRRHKRIIDDLSWHVGWRKESYNENHVKKAMKFLRESLMIDTMKEPGGVLITVLNYDKYQNPKNYERTDERTDERTIEEPLKNQCAPTYDKKKEECKEEESIRGGKNELVDDSRDKKHDNGGDNLRHSGNDIPFRASHSSNSLCSNGDNLHKEHLVKKDGADLANTGQRVNDDIHPPPGSIDMGNSGDMHGLHAAQKVDEESAELDQEEAREEIKDDSLEEKKGDEGKPPPEEKKKNGKKTKCFDLDLSKLDHQFNRDIVDEFIEYRKNVKKDPMTQRSFNGVVRNAKSTSERHGGSFNDALVYAMENKWLTPDPKYIDDNKARFASFLDEQHGPRSSEKEVNAKIADLERRARIAQEKWDREHGAVNA